MVARGYSLVSGGTDNHLLLVDLKPAGIDGARVEVRPRSISPASSGASDGLLIAPCSDGPRPPRPSSTSRGPPQAVLERANVALNKNTVPGDKSALIPGGIRIGTPALTSRGFEEAHFDTVAEFIHRGVGIAKEINAAATGKKLADFKAALGAQEHASITALRNDVEAFASQFPCIGFDQETMKYK